MSVVVVLVLVINKRGRSVVLEPVGSSRTSCQVLVLAVSLTLTLVLVLVVGSGSSRIN